MKGVTDIRTMDDCKNLVKSFSAGQKDMIPEVVTLYSCSTANAERSFSRLCRIKIYLPAQYHVPKQTKPFTAFEHL